MSENGGPIVMVQVENEYAGYGQDVDPDYLPWLRNSEVFDKRLNQSVDSID